MLGSETYLYMVINGINFTARVHPKSTTKPGDKIKVDTRTGEYLSRA